MPFVVVNRGGTPTAGPALQRLGANVRETALALGEFYERKKARASALELEQRRMAVAEKDAERRLLEEQGQAAAREAAMREREAAVSGVIESLETLGRDAQQNAFDDALRKGLSEPGGVMGPFGMFGSSTFSRGVVDMAQAKARMDSYIEKAQRMSPSEARAYLSEKKAEEQAISLARGYREEAEAVNLGVAQGIIDPAKGRRYANGLKMALKKGLSPGPIMNQVARDYDLYNQLQVRLQGWERADTAAGDLLAKMSEHLAGFPDSRVAELVAQARSEWNRTTVGHFRVKNDSEKSMNTLVNLLFRVQATTDPESMTRPSGNTLPPSYQEYLRAQDDGKPAKAPGKPQERGSARGPRGSTRGKKSQESAGREARGPGSSIARAPSVIPGPNQPARDFGSLEPREAKGFATAIKRLQETPMHPSEMRTAVRELYREWSIKPGTMDPKTIQALLPARPKPPKEKAPFKSRYDPDRERIPGEFGEQF